MRRATAIFGGANQRDAALALVQNLTGRTARDKRTDSQKAQEGSWPASGRGRHQPGRRHRGVGGGGGRGADHPHREYRHGAMSSKTGRAISTSSRSRNSAQHPLSHRRRAARADESAAAHPGSDDLARQDYERHEHRRAPHSPGRAYSYQHARQGLRHCASAPA